MLTCLRIRNPDLVMLLADKGMQPISKEQGEELAKEIGAAGYVECSALTQEGLQVRAPAIPFFLEVSLTQTAPSLQEVFNRAIRAVLQPEPLSRKRRRKRTAFLKKKLADASSRFQSACTLS